MLTLSAPSFPVIEPRAWNRALLFTHGLAKADLLWSTADYARVYREEHIGEFATTTLFFIRFTMFTTAKFKIHAHLSIQMDDESRLGLGKGARELKSNMLQAV